MYMNVNIGKHHLCVRGVHADAGVEVLHAGLDDVAQVGAEGGGLLGLQGLEHLAGEMLLQQGVTVLVTLQLLQTLLAVLNRVLGNTLILGP